MSREIDVILSAHAMQLVEGNMGWRATYQQSTRRAQNRVSVSQALNCVQKAAGQKKKEGFTALLHHISVETLETAFYALKRKAAPCVDGVTWKKYEAGLERRLIDLHGRIHRGAYRPQQALNITITLDGVPNSTLKENTVEFSSCYHAIYTLSPGNSPLESY